MGTEPPRPDQTVNNEFNEPWPYGLGDETDKWKALFEVALMERDDWRDEANRLRAALTWLVDSRPWPVAECWAHAEALLEEDDGGE